LGIINIAEFH